MGSDGVEILKQYLQAREGRGEEITPDSALFASRSGNTSISKDRLNDRIKKAAKKSGIENGNNGKYGRFRIYCLRKFFMTQLTNHGMEDRIVDFFMCHKVSQVDLSYWQRRVDQLREEYRKREKFLNPISGSASKPSTDKIEELVEKKIREFVKSGDFEEERKELQQNIEKENDDQYDSIIVRSEEEIIEYSNGGYECEKIDEGKWLMRKEI